MSILYANYKCNCKIMEKVIMVSGHLFTSTLIKSYKFNNKTCIDIIIIIEIKAGLISPQSHNVSQPVYTGFILLFGGSMHHMKSW